VSAPATAILFSGNVFGLSHHNLACLKNYFSDEYLNYALNNRQEWEDKGEKAVQDMVEKYENMDPKDFYALATGERK